MTDEFDAEFAEFERARAEAQADADDDGAAGGDMGTGGIAKVEAPASILGEFTLEDLAKPGSRFADLAAELLVAREERAAKAEAARLDGLVDTGLSDGLDFFDPEVRVALASRVASDRAESTAAFYRQRESEFSKSYGPETVAAKMADERAAAAAVEAWEAQSSSWEQHPLYVEHQAREVEHQRALAFARDRSSDPFFGGGVAAEEVAATYRALVESVEGAE